MLILNADNDPIVPLDIISGVEANMGLRTGDTEHHKNSNLVLALTRGGGHLGWWTGFKPKRWLKQPVGEFVRMIFSQEAQERGLKDLSQKKSPWNQKDRVQEKQVVVELLDSDCLPSYQAQTGDEKVEAVVESNKALESKISGNRMPWLLTRILESAPLVHPSQAKGYVTPQPHQTEKLHLVMYLDSARPEVGFAELPQDCKVSGTGSVFQGGKEIPGWEWNDEKDEKKKRDGLVAGL